MGDDTEALPRTWSRAADAVGDSDAEIIFVECFVHGEPCPCALSNSGVVNVHEEYLARMQIRNVGGRDFFVDMVFVCRALDRGLGPLGNGI